MVGKGLRTWDSGPAWQERCDQVEAEVRGRFVGQDVIFTGRLSKPALARVLMQSDVCLYPCNFFETFCLTALECQAAGVPIVTSEFGALATTLGAWRRREDPGASEFAGISAAVRAGGGGRAAGR